MSVILTVRARQAPIDPPIPTPAITRIHELTPDGGWEASVVRTASAIPDMPKRLPGRDVAGDDRPRSDRMKSMPATR